MLSSSRSVITKSNRVNWSRLRLLALLGSKRMPSFGFSTSLISSCNSAYLGSSDKLPHDLSPLPISNYWTLLGRHVPLLSSERQPDAEDRRLNRRGIRFLLGGEHGHDLAECAGFGRAHGADVSRVLGDRRVDVGR